jgi:hypothetical protein
MDGRKANNFPEITNKWRIAAEDLARIYREKVLGQQIQ